MGDWGHTLQCSGASPSSGILLVVFRGTNAVPGIELGGSSMFKVWTWIPCTDLILLDGEHCICFFGTAWEHPIHIAGLKSSCPSMPHIICASMSTDHYLCGQNSWQSITTAPWALECRVSSFIRVTYINQTVYLSPDSPQISVPNSLSTGSSCLWRSHIGVCWYRWGISPSGQFLVPPFKLSPSIESHRP